jgi:hypothetical protein
MAYSNDSTVIIKEIKLANKGYICESNKCGGIEM